MGRDYAFCQAAFYSTTGSEKAMGAVNFYKARASLELEKNAHQPTIRIHPLTELKLAEALLQALEDAKSFKDRATTEAAEATVQKEAAETTAAARCAELEDLKKPFYKKAWDFVTRPKTLWNEARKNFAN